MQSWIWSHTNYTLIFSRVLIIWSFNARPWPPGTVFIQIRIHEWLVLWSEVSIGINLWEREREETEEKQDSFMTIFVS